MAYYNTKTKWVKPLLQTVKCKTISPKVYQLGHADSELEESIVIYNSCTSTSVLPKV